MWIFNVLGWSYLHIRNRHCAKVFYKTLYKNRTIAIVILTLGFLSIKTNFYIKINCFSKTFNFKIKNRFS